MRMTWIKVFDIPEQPKVVQGVLDLRKWDHLEDHAVSLSGEWAYFPRNLVANNASQEVSKEQFKSLPGVIKHDEENEYNYDSYRLKIYTNLEEENRFALTIPKVHNVANVYINNELQTQVSEENKREVARNQNLTFINNGSEPIEIVIQITSDKNAIAGILTPIYFGMPANVEQHLNFSTGIVLLACAIYLLHAIYAFIIYLMSKRVQKNPSLLYFSLMILLVVYATLATENILFEWTSISYLWHTKLMNVGMLLGGYLMMQVAKYQNVIIGSRKWYKAYQVLFVILLLMVPLFPFDDPFVYYSSLVFTLISSIILVKEIFKLVTVVHKNNVFLFLALITALYSFVWLIIIEIKEINVISYPFDLVVAIIFIAIHFFNQYFSSVVENQLIMEDLKRADKIKDDFVLSVAYEMKNPLSRILWISKVLSLNEKKRMSKAGAESLELLDNVAHQMSFMLNDLLELEKIKGNQLAIKKQAVSVHPVAESVVDMLKFMVDEKKLQIKNEIPLDFPTVEADKTRLNQILFNLIHNAIKFSDTGIIRITAEKSNGMAILHVSDTGRGIDKSFIDRIFDPYSKRYSEQIQYDKGIGLGLSLCKKLVELQGGTISVQSIVEKGSTFTFTLNLYGSTEEEIQIASVDHDVDQEVMAVFPTPSYQVKDLDYQPIVELIRILVIDDDVVTLKMIKATFSSDIYQVITVTQPEEGLRLLKERPWDLVIADVTMPQMSGYEFTRKIREIYTMAELPVLLLSNYIHEDNIKYGFLAGANDYVNKPLNSAEFYSRVNSLANLKKSVNEQLRTEAAWLQAQIRPHFLINSFLSIAALSRIDLNRMDALTQQLSNYIRLSIDFNNTEKLSTICREIELVKSYLAIQKERFGERVDISWDVEENLSINIPPLSVQCLVENALIHGIFKKEDGGKIRISIKTINKNVAIEVSDTGVGMSPEKVEEVLNRHRKKGIGIGLINTDKRLRQMYGKGLEIESWENKGTKVTITIPIQTDIDGQEKKSTDVEISHSS